MGYLNASVADASGSYLTTSAVENWILHCHSKRDIENWILHCHSKRDIENWILHCHSKRDIENWILHCHSKRDIENWILHCHSKHAAESYHWCSCSVCGITIHISRCSKTLTYQCYSCYLGYKNVNDKDEEGSYHLCRCNVISKCLSNRCQRDLTSPLMQMQCSITMS